MTKGESDIPQSSDPEDDYQAIDYIMENFDWARVLDVMHRIGWKWATVPGGIPTSDQLREQGHQYLRQVSGEDIAHRFIAIGSGGFQAARYICPDGTRIFELQFILADWDNRR